MNFTLTKPMAEDQVTAAAPKFRVAILYECVETGKHAKMFCDQLCSEVTPDRLLDLNLWSFRVLEMPEVHNTAACAGADSEMVIFSTSGRKPLPTPVEEWIELWSWLMEDHQPVVFALFTDPDAESTGIQTCLRHTAASKGLDFFVQTTGSLGDAHRDARVSDLVQRRRQKFPHDHDL